MSDFISREEVKKILRTEWVKLFPMELDPYLSLAMEEIENIPSVQPEIIRCKDCKWWDRDPERVYGYCMAIKHGYHSRNWEIGIYRKYKGDFYCADAVIEEESDDDE